MSRQEIKTWIPLLILGVALAVVFAPLLVGQRVLFWGLPALQFYPWRAFAFEQIHNGSIPFWNPYSGGGAPLLANYQSAVMYPPNWLHLFLNNAYAMNLLAVLHIFWAGLGMWMLTGELGVVPLGRGISAMSFAMSGYLIARMGSLPTSNAVAWMPWLFWGVAAVCERRRLHFVGLLGLITAMMLLTGHAQTSFYALFAAGLFTLWYAMRVGGSERLMLFAMVGGGVLLGFGIASTQLLFTAELLSESQRAGGMDFKTLTNLSFSPLRIINFFTPNFFGSPVDGTYLTPGKGVYFEDAVYIGFLPLVSAVAAISGWLQWRSLLMEPRRAFRSVPLWILLTVIGFVLGMGRYTPVYHWLYEYVPTFDAFREPVRWMIYPVFSLCVMAGIGAQNWGRTQRVFFWTRLSGAGGAGMVVLAIVVRQFDQSGSEYVPVLTGSLVAMGSWMVGACLLTLAQPDDSWNVPRLRWQLAVLLFVIADLVWAANGLNPTVPQQFYREASITEPQGRLYWFEDYKDEIMFQNFFDLSDYRKARRDWPRVRRSLLPNLNMLDDVATFNNFDPLVPAYHARYVELIEQRAEDSAALLRAAAVGQVYGDVQPEGWEKIDGEIPSYKAPTEPPLAWVVPEAEYAQTLAQERRFLLDKNWSPEQTVILSEAPPDEGTAPENALTEVSFFEVQRDSPDNKRFRVVTDGSGYLVLANTWYPGWSVKVNGESAELVRANMSFMAVKLPPGGGEVTFRYLPTINLLSLGISFVSVSAMLVLIALGLVRQVDREQVQVA